MKSRVSFGIRMVYRMVRWLQRRAADVDLMLRYHRHSAQPTSGTAVAAIQAWPPNSMRFGRSRINGLADKNTPRGGIGRETHLADWRLGDTLSKRQRNPIAALIMILLLVPFPAAAQTELLERVIRKIERMNETIVEARHLIALTGTRNAERPLRAAIRKQAVVKQAIADQVVREAPLRFLLLVNQATADARQAIRLCLALQRKTERAKLRVETRLNPLKSRQRDSDRRPEVLGLVEATYQAGLRAVAEHNLPLAFEKFRFAGSLLERLGNRRPGPLAADRPNANTDATGPVSRLGQTIDTLRSAVGDRPELRSLLDQAAQLYATAEQASTAGQHDQADKLARMGLRITNRIDARLSKTGAPPSADHVLAMIARLTALRDRLQRQNSSSDPMRDRLVDIDRRLARARQLADQHNPQDAARMLDDIKRELFSMLTEADG